ncbi:MAG: AAA family ATPase [Alphaproteobacteria bacterium]|nr:AAA family ATPase [Alphaproteobacteria bacterium]MBL7098661.1 AAA family ATPase [Alphaproteobacteria bacterium]
MSIKPLGAEKLRRVTDPTQLPFKTTDTLPEPVGPVGQDRAMRALHFGAGMAQAGYNIFVTGPTGTGKRAAVSRALKRLAASMPAAQDIAYVHNFAAPHRPCALRFAAGEGAKFRAAMQEFTDSLKGAMPKLFEGDDYRQRRAALEEEFHVTAESTFELLRKQADIHGLALVERGEGAFDFRPSRDGLVLSEDEYRATPKAERDRLLGRVRELRAALEKAVERLERLRQATLEHVSQIDREMGEHALRALAAPLSQRYAGHREAHAYIEAVFRDAVAQIDLLQAVARGETDERSRREGGVFHRYEVNLIVDNGGAGGAPVVTLGLPSVTSLIGKIEHVPVLMTVVTDFMFIKPGALHCANGGFLLIDAMDLFRQELSWETLKRALKARQVKIESVADILDRTQTVTIQPEPLPLDVKIVLFGEPWVYHRLCQFDPEFADLFKVQADFSTTALRTEENCADLLFTMASIARTDGLKHLDTAGAARLLDEASRQAGDAEKVSVRLGRLADIVREGDHYAALDGRSLISAADIARAVAARDDRSGRLKALEHELIQRRIVFIDTDGARAGQVNGLTVLSAAGFAFGVPARITARVAPGDGRVIDIERLARFAGPSHVKGVQILSGYLNGAYAIGRPLSVSASVAFEQSYGAIDGDSAAAAELIAILSAIADVPTRQGIAITGSVNQHGEMQPIGGANEKIEGFFDVCAARGLGRHHGVIIPKANLVSLMLREDVVQAVRDGRFAVYALDTVDEAIEVLTGMPAGSRRRDGTFPRGSFNRLVRERLIDFARPRVLKPVHLDGWWRF